MLHLHHFLIFALVAFTATVKALECSVPNFPKTKKFTSLSSYQANTMIFDPRSQASQGSRVEFSFKTISNLPKNSFITFDSEHITQLVLTGKNIKQVEEGAFSSLGCLHILSLDRNNISQISEDVFQGLDNLRVLNLSQNHITELPDIVFFRLSHLETLDLSRNRIKVLSSLAFLNLSLLKELNLESNEIRTVRADVLQPLTSLNVLILAFNKLRGIEPEKWPGLVNLERLDLAGNYLDSFDPSYNLSFSSLKSLNLSLNYLTQLNVFALRQRLPSLVLIDLNDNPWFCDDLASINHQLADSKIKYPGRNTSAVNDDGIACRNDASKTYTRPPVVETTTPPTTTTTTITTIPDPISRRLLDEILTSNRKIIESNTQIFNYVRYIQSMTVFLFIIVVIFIVFEVVLRSDCCRPIYDRFNSGNFYQDDNGAENFRLLHR